VGLGTLGLRMTWTWNSIGLLVAVLGTTISPYMFFWQSAHRIEEMRSESGTSDASKPLPERSPRKAGTKLFLSRIDVFVGMLVLSATINGIAAAPFLVVIMVISGSRKLLGDYRDGPLATAAGWATV
jgi:Mn2+/Fe2+ NRAMP family transporter